LRTVAPLLLLMADVVIGHAPITGAFGVTDWFVFVHRVGVAGDDIPGVDEAGEIAEAAECDVDERVGGAETAFDPYCDRRKEDGNKGEEDVAAGHGGGGRCW